MFLHAQNEKCFFHHTDLNININKHLLEEKAIEHKSYTDVHTGLTAQI